MFSNSQFDTLVSLFDVQGLAHSDNHDNFQEGFHENLNDGNGAQQSYFDDTNTGFSQIGVSYISDLRERISDTITPFKISKSTGFYLIDEITDASPMEEYLKIMHTHIIYFPEDSIADNQKFYFPLKLFFDSKLKTLKNKYTFVNCNELTPYLKNNPDLIDALEHIYGKLIKFSEVKSLSLRHIQDPEDGWQNITVTAYTDANDARSRMALWRKYLFGVLAPLEDRMNSMLTLQVR
ncbi:MAG: hypothetical protein K0U66_03120 [Gammaproteobacteria bacterium]|nr:hypothetical protein [Gammaproteobacteria bacterium]